MIFNIRGVFNKRGKRLHIYIYVCIQIQQCWAGVCPLSTTLSYDRASSCIVWVLPRVTVYTRATIQGLLYPSCENY